MNIEFKNFKEFYPYYLSQHSHPTCRKLHFIGCLFVLLCLLYFLFTGHFFAIIAALLFGYGFAWIGHFYFEKNKPATFTHPFYSFLGDWVMFKDILLRKLK